VYAVVLFAVVVGVALNVLHVFDICCGYKSGILWGGWDGNGYDVDTHVVFGYYMHPPA
jgi:hypothetical protein